jgi:hypothetical protein
MFLEGKNTFEHGNIAAVFVAESKRGRSLVYHIQYFGDQDYRFGLARILSRKLIIEINIVHLSVILEAPLPNQEYKSRPENVWLLVRSMT